MDDRKGGKRPVNQAMRINILRVTAVLLFAFILLVDPYFGYDSFTHELIEATGILFLLIGVLGRFWSILYVGSRKNEVVMQDGPYSVTRNPLYLFSTIAATGIGLMMGAVTFGLVVGASVGMILYVTARKEADFLEARFGAPYLDYARRVPFFFPNPRQFRSGESVTFSVATLRRNFFDALVFLSFIPIVEVLDRAKEAWSAGFLHVF